MVLTRRDFSKVAIAGLAVSVAAEGMAMSSVNANRSSEAAALIRFAEETHPRGREAREDDDWRARAAELMRLADGHSVAAYVVAAFRLLAWFEDGHTTIWAGALQEGPFGLRLPVLAYPFFDGLYVIGATGSTIPLLGAKIERIGNLETSEIARRFAAIWPAGNPAWAHHDLGLLLRTPGFLHGLGAIDGSDTMPVPIEVRLLDGSTVRTDLVPHPERGEISRVERTTTPREQWASEAGGGNYVRRLADRSAIYVSIDSMMADAGESASFTREISTAMSESRESRLILDFRRNPGGNNYHGEALRRIIGRSRFNRPGGLYVLVGPQTFSAAQNVVNRLERETFALFVGEPTGGSPNHYGDSAQFGDDDSTLSGGVSTIAWFDSYPQDERRWIAPDILLPRTFAEWHSGQDRVLEAGLAHAVGTPLDDFHDDRLYYFNRASQATDWHPFWLHPAS